MDTSSKVLDNAIEQLASLPGIGRRSALRLALKLLNKDKEDIIQFGESFIELANNINYCKKCHNISDTDICKICSNPSRNHSTVCVVEDIRDVMAIENTLQYKGIYHVLGGVISPMDGVGPNDLNIETLINKVQNEDIQEVILALNASMEGDTTAFYLYKKISNPSIKLTTIARGISIGDELQHADEVTLGRSITNRTQYKAGI